MTDLTEAEITNVKNVEEMYFGTTFVEKVCKGYPLPASARNMTIAMQKSFVIKAKAFMMEVLKNNPELVSKYLINLSTFSLNFLSAEPKLHMFKNLEVIQFKLWSQKNSRYGA